MSDSVTFTVPGPPQPLHRHRTTRTGRTYDDPRNATNKQAVQWAAKRVIKSPLDGPVAVHVACSMVKPKSAKREHPTVTPDVDNLGKLILDSLNKLAWKDDAQVVDLTVTKRYADTPCTQITIERVSE